MMIHEMSREACHRVLANSKLARLGCAHNNQPYVVPVYLAFDQESECFYGFTTPGQKVEWMRANPLVCVEVDDITSYDQWVSVIAIGHYEELPESQTGRDSVDQAPERPKLAAETTLPCSADNRPRSRDRQRDQAWEVLKTNPVWWEPGCVAWAARAHRDTDEPFIAVYYRIKIEHVTGHEATRDAKNTSSTGDSKGPPTGNWLRLFGALARVFGDKSKAADSSF